MTLNVVIIYCQKYAEISLQELENVSSEFAGPNNATNRLSGLNNMTGKMLEIQVAATTRGVHNME